MDGKKFKRGIVAVVLSGALVVGIAPAAFAGTSYTA